MTWLQHINLLFLLFCLVFLNYTYSGLRKLGRKMLLQSGEKVKISIVIPFRNEIENLPELLNCLQGQNYDKAWYEVIFVDDHSSDGGAEYLEKTAGSLNMSIKLERLKEGVISKKRALESGIGLAEGELIITTDADVTMGVNWLSGIAAVYAEGKADMILGCVAIKNAVTMPERFEKMDCMALQTITASFAANGNAILCNGANLAYSRKDFIDLGGYSQTAETVSGDDFFLLMKFKNEGLRNITYLPGEATAVYVKPAKNLKAFIRQRMRWASKTRHAQSLSVLIPSSWIFLTSLWMIVLPLLELCSASFPWSTLLFYAVKCAGDLLLLRNWSALSGQSFSVFEFIFSFALYPFYICFIVVYSLFFGTEWKGRKVPPAI